MECRFESDLMKSPFKAIIGNGFFAVPNLLITSA